MSKEAEIYLLSCCFQKPEIVRELDLTSDDFSLENRALYIGLETLRVADKLELNEVIDFFDKQGRFNDYRAISTTLASPEHVQDYAKNIKRDSNSAALARKGQEIIEIASGYGDFSDKLESSLSLFDDLKVEGVSNVVTSDSLAVEYMEHLEKTMNMDGIDGLSTGFELIDDRLQGLKPGELIIVAGRSGMGKSTYALNIACHAAQSIPVVFFSLEMPAKQLAQKSVASLGGVDVNWLKGGMRTDPSQWGLTNEGMSKFRDLNLIIDDSSSQTAQSIAIACKKIPDVGLVIVDHIQLMSGVGNTRAEQIGSNSRSLKKLSKDLNCPVIALSQLNRGVESRANRRPLMSDLKESGDLEADSDIVQLVYRDEYYYPDYPFNRGYAEINTAKFRDGEVGMDILATDLAKSKFKDVTTFSYQPYSEEKKSNGFSG